MSYERDIANFRAQLMEAFSAFRASEGQIREQFNQGLPPGATAPEAEVEELLERPTRRFLIDGILRALDWNPDRPDQVAEEARSWDELGNRLYFDYLAIAPVTRAPVVLVEAKGYDVGSPRSPYDGEPHSNQMRTLLKEAIGSIKGRRRAPVVAEWVEWLTDLKGYVTSLGDVGRASLKRVVATAGRWIIVFADPIACFLAEGDPDESNIYCYASLEEIVGSHEELFRLLNRQWLVNTLPKTMDLPAALETFRPELVDSMFRGVVVATTTSGGKRKPYPTRAIYPAVIVHISNRAFAIVDYRAHPPEEPLQPERFEGFIEELTRQGDAFQAEVLARLGRPELRPRPLAEFPGWWSGPTLPGTVAERLPPATGTTANLRGEAIPRGKVFVEATGEINAANEYVVVTGERWFYKSGMAQGPACAFHDWPAANRAGQADAAPHMTFGAASYTMSGLDRHCEHAGLRGMRRARCHVEVVDDHLCCRACAFFAQCWEREANRLPCPS